MASVRGGCLDHGPSMPHQRSSCARACLHELALAADVSSAVSRRRACISYFCGDMRADAERGEASRIPALFSALQSHIAPCVDAAACRWTTSVKLGWASGRAALKAARYSTLAGVGTHLLSSCALAPAIRQRRLRFGPRCACAFTHTHWAAARPREAHSTSRRTSRWWVRCSGWLCTTTCQAPRGAPSLRPAVSRHLA